MFSLLGNDNIDHSNLSFEFGYLIILSQMAGSLYVKTSNRLCNFKDRIVIGNGNSFPVSIEIHLTNYCNNTCSFCWASRIRSGFAHERLSYEVVKKLILDLKNSGLVSVVLSGGGEPTLHPDFERIVNLIRENDIEVGIITNGILLNDSVKRAILKSNWVKFSLHASTPELYSLIIENKRFGNQIFERIVGDVRAVVKERDGAAPRISVGYIVNQINQSDDSIYAFVEFAFNDLNVDYALIQPYVGFDERLIITRSRESYSDLLDKVNKLTYNKKVFANIGSFVKNINGERLIKCGKCPIVQTGLIAMINYNGDVYPCQPLLRKSCQYDGIVKENYILGNLNNDTFERIWLSEKRNNYLTKQDNVDCVPCRFEKMFGWYDKIKAAPETVNENKLDPNWKFIA